MRQVFGGPCRARIEDRPAAQTIAAAAADMNFTAQTLVQLGDGRPGVLRIYQPAPTAAFAISESHFGRFRDAQKAVADLGFAPLMRQPGGHLAIYDGASIIVDVIATGCSSSIAVAMTATWNASTRSRP